MMRALSSALALAATVANADPVISEGKMGSHLHPALTRIRSLK